jgi:Ca-activated chloride channel family protein
MPAPCHIGRLICLACLLAAPFTLRAQQQTGASAQPAQPQLTPVVLTVTVTDDHGRYVTGLSKDAFSVYEGKETHALTSFNDQDTPASVLILLDVSGSTIDRLKEVRPAILSFIQQGNPETEYWLGEFDSGMRSLNGWTRDAELLGERLKLVGPSKGKNVTHQTGMYDACVAALEQFKSDSGRRHIILLVSDGLDNASRTSFLELRRKLQESDVIFYIIGVMERGTPSELNIAGEEILKELAKVTGGVAFFPENRTIMNQIAERIALELRHQYSVGFVPAGAQGAGKWSKVKIKVTPPNKQLKNLSVRSRGGYLAKPSP